MMDKMIVALFGVNRMNLWGWVVGGYFVMGSAGYMVAGAFIPAIGFGFTPEIALLTAACLLLLGIFGVLLQMYCSLLAIKLDLLGRSKADEKPGI